MAPASRCREPPRRPIQQNLWVVPYAGRNPPMLVGRALCRAEPSGKGAGGPLNPRNGRRGPAGQRFEATPPLRGAAVGVTRM